MKCGDPRESLFGTLDVMTWLEPIDFRLPIDNSTAKSYRISYLIAISCRTDKEHLY